MEIVAAGEKSPHRACCALMQARTEIRYGRPGLRPEALQVVPVQGCSAVSVTPSPVAVNLYTSSCSFPAGLLTVTVIEESVRAFRLGSFGPRWLVGRMWLVNKG